MVAICPQRIKWELLSETAVSRIMNNIAIDFKLKEGVTEPTHRVYLLKFLKKLYTAIDYEHVEKAIIGYTAMPIALRFSRMTIKDMLMDEEEEEGEEPLIKMWLSMSKFAQKLYYNPKVVFLHNLLSDFWEVIDQNIAREMIEYLIILVSQTDTKRFMKYLVRDSLFIKHMQRHEIFQNNIVIRKLVGNLDSFLYENEEAALTRLTLLKKLAYKYFPEELARSCTNQQNESGSLSGKQYLQNAMKSDSVSKYFVFIDV